MKVYICTACAKGSPYQCQRVNTRDLPIPDECSNCSGSLSGISVQLIPGRRQASHKFTRDQLIPVKI